MGSIRLEVLVAGRVQGVAFRQATAEVAGRLGLRGFVRNLPDGRVEVVAEGGRAPLEALLGFCRRGPALARVGGVEVAWGEARGDLGPFEVRRTDRA